MEMKSKTSGAGGERWWEVVVSIECSQFKLGVTENSLEQKFCFRTAEIYIRIFFFFLFLFFSIELGIFFLDRA